MELSEAIQKRKSIRKFREKAIPREEIQELIDAACQAPSGKNLQPWHFTVLTGSPKQELVEVMLEAVGKLEKKGIPTGSCRGTARAMAQAPVVILVFNTRGNPLNPPRGSDRYLWSVNIQSIGAAIQNMLLAATERGLGSLWICDTFYADPEIRDWLGRKDELVAAVALGYPDEAPQARPRKSCENVTRWLEEG